MYIDGRHGPILRVNNLREMRAKIQDSQLKRTSHHARHIRTRAPPGDEAARALPQTQLIKPFQKHVTGPQASALATPPAADRLFRRGRRRG
ncbi:hypothetical protein EVAR_52297_1 [Eumeta japonica]|uniref:Uncharacterized protein n=1 Tax=Eumeta variegata TaxID=151549 RepID=A0A4C1Y309_EUMVA|nr:hypothetical protein EVAR_52297_1 [Eumeta japonica]